MTDEQIAKLREKALSLIALEIADDDMGIYPSASKGGASPYEKRTDFMEGWNAYGKELLEKCCVVQKWMTELPPENKHDIEDFLLNGNLRINVREGKVHLWVLCNDLFFWGCADGEAFDLGDLPDLKKSLQDSPANGDELWCCRKRGMRPQKPYYKGFTDEETILFDAAGPERADE